jgi:carbonic anhydrase
VLQYAVEHLDVQHGYILIFFPRVITKPNHPPFSSVIVVGHTKCGGVGACYDAVLSAAANDGGLDDPSSIIPVPDHPPTDPINVWLKPLTYLAVSLFPDYLAGMPPEKANRALAEENVKRQVSALVETEVVKHAWKEGKDVWVHGWVFEMECGRLVDLNVSKGPKKVCW